MIIHSIELGRWKLLFETFKTYVTSPPASRLENFKPYIKESNNKYGLRMLILIALGCVLDLNVMDIHKAQ